LDDDIEDDQKVLSMLDRELEKQRKLASAITVKMRSVGEIQQVEDLEEANKSDDLKIQLIKTE
jgi:hypothetical protein